MIHRDVARAVPRLRVDADLCHGCQSCMVSCSLVHEGQVIPSRARIQVLVDPFSGTHQIRYCHQCRRAPCARACPYQAIRQVEAGQPWTVDETLCDGCGACIVACPFEAMVLAYRGERTVAAKCDTCNGQPECVASCPKGALSWSDQGEGS